MNSYNSYKVITASKTGRQLIIDIRQGTTIGAEIEIIYGEKIY